MVIMATTQNGSKMNRERNGIVSCGGDKVEEYLLRTIFLCPYNIKGSNSEIFLFIPSSTSWRRKCFVWSATALRHTHGHGQFCLPFTPLFSGIVQPKKSPWTVNFNFWSLIFFTLLQIITWKVRWWILILTGDFSHILKYINHFCQYAFVALEAYLVRY